MHSKLKYIEIAPCIFAIIIDAMGFGLVYPVMTGIFTATHSPVLPANASVHVRHFYLGLGFMLYPLCMFFGSSFMADLSDKYGRKNILMICMLGIAISFALMGFGVTFSSLFLLLIGRAFSGLMAGSQPIAQAAISDLSTKENKARNLSIVALSYCFGSVLGPLIGGVTSDDVLVSWFNFSTPFYIAGILSFIALVWIIIAFRETSKVRSQKPFIIYRPLQIFSEVFAHKTVRLLAIIFLLMQIGFSIYFQFILVLMRYEYNFPNWQLGTLQGVIGIGFAAGLLIGIPYSLKYWRTEKIASVNIALTGVGVVLAAISTIVSSQWLLAFLIASFDIMAFTVMLTLFSNSVDETSQGWVMGIANSVMALSWAISGLGSNLLNLMGTRGLIFAGGICLILGSIILESKKKKLTPQINVEL